MRSGLVNITQEDQQLAKLLLADPRPILLNFAAGLIRECLSSDPPIASQGSFAYTLEVLTQLAQAGKANEEYVFLLSAFRFHSHRFFVGFIGCSTICEVYEGQ